MTILKSTTEADLEEALQRKLGSIANPAQIRSVRSWIASIRLARS